ncbi:MAG: DUF1080 domain-containing protein [Verrucomicrobiales bacterium]|nr:DUF1080 domain-containing protein [Verrucomicrobiales bacterium]
MKHSLLPLLIAAVSLTAATAEERWTNLIQGDSLAGWKQLGGKAAYVLKDGVIIGTSVPREPNSFLCTEKSFSNFILEYEFSVEDTLNSGVQIRSNSLPDFHNGRVHGYQVEIDADQPNRKWTGGLYEEGRRGWLFNLKDRPAAQNAAKRGGAWNQVRVEAIGPHLKTFVNGVPCADLLDAFTTRGFIGLQVHGVGNDAAKVGKTARWRNLRIQDLGEAKWVPAFPDGKTQGWQPTPGGKWEMINGILTGTSPQGESRHGIFLSDKSWSDFAIRFKFRVTKGNSGFYFRSERVQDAVAVAGFQAELDETPATGGLYETGGRGWVAQTDPKSMEAVYKPHEWNEMCVICQGNRTVVQVWRWEDKNTLRWVKSAELTSDQGRREGHFGFQLHGGMEMQVEFKDVEILAGKAAQP